MLYEVITSPIGGTQYYEIEIDGAIINNEKGTIYIQGGFNMDRNHTIRVRSVNLDGYGLWSELINTLPPATTRITSYNVCYTKLLRF